jgi:hypothetical protein
LNTTAPRFARKHRKILYKYYNPKKMGKGHLDIPNKTTGIPPNSYSEEVDHGRVGFSEHFVHGAPGRITTNIMASKGVANGSPCRYHSMIFHADNEALVDDLLRTCRADSTDLKSVVGPKPAYINVFIDGQFMVNVGRQSVEVTNSDFFNQMHENLVTGNQVHLRWNDAFRK